LPMSLMMTTRGWPVKSSTCVGGSSWAQRTLVATRHNIAMNRSLPTCLIQARFPLRTAGRRNIVWHEVHIAPVVSPRLVNAPPPNRRWLLVTAGSRIDRPCGRLHHVEVIVWFRRLLLLDISLPHLIRHIAARCYPVPACPQMLAPVPFPKSRVLA